MCFSEGSWHRQKDIDGKEKWMMTHLDGGDVLQLITLLKSFSVTFCMSRNDDNKMIFIIVIDLPLRVVKRRMKVYKNARFNN